ncbi:3411_t:CDS:2 [Entrophospora sp. SA101]|nr:3411_t:CDS:2 [Entrophospora sp. SA101]CAJ0825345.1 6177_t:CDS:2 [Entrophospora sp. SA101]
MSLKSQENKRKKESGVIKTRNPEGQKSSHEQKKRRTVNDEPTEESVLFDESNEDVLINSIDKSDLKGETTLPVSKKIIDTSKQEFLQRISKKFKNYQEKIPKSRQIITLGYWGIFDLTQESLYGCIEFSQSEINEISQGFANSVHWSPQPTPKNLCEYFDSGCDPVKLVDYEDNEKLHANIQFIIFNMSKKGAKTEEELKFTTIYPLFNAVMDTSLVKDICCSIPSNKENCALLEGAFCLLKELERKLTETEKLIQEFQTENIRGKCRQVAIENSPTLNLNRTP